MSKSFRIMRFWLYQDSVKLDDILEQFESHSSYILKPQETRGKFSYCGDLNPDDPCRDYIRSTVPANSAGDVSSFEYFENEAASGINASYLLQSVRLLAYADSLEDFTSFSGIDASMLKSHADFCGYFSVVQLREALSLPLKISLETVTFDDYKDQPVKLLEVKDLLCPEDFTVPIYSTVDGYFDSVKSIILKNFGEEMFHILTSIPDIGRSFHKQRSD